MKTSQLRRVLVAKSTVFVGLAMLVAVVLGAASTALAANGQSWILGQNNVATAITKLGGALGVNGPTVQLTNNNADANDTALSLNVEAGEPPMAVNSSTRVTNLNADKLDGLDEAAFMEWDTDLNTKAGKGDPGQINEKSILVVACDEGDFPLGGGASGVDAGTILLNSYPDLDVFNDPDEDHPGWVVQILNNHTLDQEFRAHVICGHR